MPLDPALVAAIRELDREVFNVVGAGADAPSDEELAAFEEQLGFRLPEDFREFCKSPAGGFYLEVREQLWPQPELFTVGPFWSFLRGLKVFGIAKAIPQWLDLRVQLAEFAAKGQARLVPFLALEGSSDRYVFDRKGRIFEWHHDDPDLQPVEGGFTALLLREIAALEERKNRKLAAAATAPKAGPRAKATPRGKTSRAKTAPGGKSTRVKTAPKKTKAKTPARPAPKRGSKKKRGSKR